MRLGYNTNGFAHHRLEDAIEILADIGYASVALTMDHHALDPWSDDFDAQRLRVARLLDRHGLHCVIETGARFLLDPRRKHQPTLLDASEAQRGRRRDLLLKAIALAPGLNADAVSFWSGALPEGASPATAMTRLVEECRRLAEAAERHEVRLAFEPEPGMFIDTMARFADLHARVAHPLFGLTLDVGHVHCLDDGAVGTHIGNWSSRLFNVHLEDMKRGVHEHLMFGEGEMDIAAVLSSLLRAGYAHGAHVELSRHGHDAVATAEAAFVYLSALIRI